MPVTRPSGPKFDPYLRHFLLLTHISPKNALANLLSQTAQLEEIRPCIHGCLFYTSNIGEGEVTSDFLTRLDGELGSCSSPRSHVSS
jgi:hypothetical protein